MVSAIFKGLKMKLAIISLSVGALLIMVGASMSSALIMASPFVGLMLAICIKGRVMKNFLIGCLVFAAWVCLMLATFDVFTK